MKRPVSLVIGIIVLVLGILGFKSYFDDYSLKIGKIGFNDSGSDGEIGTTKGDYVFCSGSYDGLTQSIYMEFKNDKVNEIAIGKFSSKYTDELKQRYTKEELEKEMYKQFCTGSNGLYNCNISWDGDNIVALGNTKVPEEYKGLSKAEAKLKMEDTNKYMKCTDSTTAPKVSGSIDTYANVIQNEQAKDESVNRTPETEKQTTTTNSHEKDCLQFATGNRDDKRSEGINYSFYCDKNIVQRKVRVEIVGLANQDKSVNYTEETYKKYLKEQFCDKYNLINCEYTWRDSIKEADLLAECRTNYAGLSVDTVEGLLENGHSIEESLEAICEK